MSKFIYEMANANQVFPTAVVPREIHEELTMTLRALSQELNSASYLIRDAFQTATRALLSENTGFEILKPDILLQSGSSSMPASARLFDFVNSLTETTRNQKINAREIITKLAGIRGFLEENDVKIRLSVDAEILFVRKTLPGMKYLIVGPEDNYMAYGLTGNQPGNVDYFEGELTDIIQKFVR